jgi:hypothetical protein
VIESPPPPRTTVLEIAVFLAELVLLAELAVVAAAVDGPLLGQIAFGIMLPAAVAVLWGRWLAPRSAHRLAWARGFTLKFVLFIGAALALWVTSGLGWAIGVALPCLLVVVAGEIARR